MGIIVQQDHEDTRDDYLGKLPNLMYGQILEDISLTLTFFYLEFTYYLPTTVMTSSS